MKDVRITEYNGYAYSDKGIRYRAVAIAGAWRLTEFASYDRWDFVNDVKYNSALEALSIIDTL